MAAFNAIDYLKARLADAQKAFEEDKARFMKAQAAWQSANNLVLACQRLLEEEIARQREGSAVASASDAVVSTDSAVATLSVDASENKTELIKDLLRQHANGLTPIEVWKALRGLIKHQPYVYSVLKRLKDKGQVAKRRGGRYFLVEPEAAPEQPDTATSSEETNLRHIVRSA